MWIEGSQSTEQTKIKATPLTAPLFFVLFCFYELKSFEQIMPYHSQNGQGTVYTGNKS